MTLIESPYLLVVAPKTHINQAACISKLISELTLRGIDRLEVLCFSDHNHQALFERISTCVGNLTILNTAFYLDQAKFRTRNAVNEFVCDIRRKILALSRKVVSRKWADRMAELWWYSFLSEKNNVGEDVWWSLFYIDALDQVLAQKGYEGILFTGPLELGGAVRHLCRSRRIPCRLLNMTAGKNKNFRMPFIRVAGFLTSIVIMILSKAVWAGVSNTARQKKQDRNRKRVLLFSSYPRLWVETSGQWHDRYYGGTFAEIAKKEGLDPLYVFFVLDRTNILYFRYVVERALRLKKGCVNKDFVLLESLLSVKDIFSAYFNVRDLISFYKVFRSSEFSSIFIYRGIDVFTLFSYHILKSVWFWWPGISLLEKTVENAARDLDPALSLIPFFEYNTGRAMVRGIQKGNGSRTMGFQHGPVTYFKMTYAGKPEEMDPAGSGGKPIPAPDTYCLDGQLPREILVKKGVPLSRIAVTGAPRYDCLWERAKSSAGKERFKRGKTRIVVAAGLHDAEAMVMLTLEALAGNPSYEIKIRLHPKYVSAGIDRLVQGYRQRSGGDKSELEVSRQGSIYDWFEQADLCIVTYSATGIEAAAFGLAVVVLHLKSMPDLSGMCYEGSPVVFVSTADELSQSVTKIVSDEIFRKTYQLSLMQVVDRNLYRLPGRSAAEAIAGCVSNEAQDRRQ